MKNKILTLAILLTVLCLVMVPSKRSVMAQSVTGATLVQQTATMLNAAPLACTTANGINAQVTCTLTPTPGQYVYITSIVMTACNNATGIAVTNLSFTTTNITGSPLFGVSIANAVNICAPPIVLSFVTPQKSSAPTTAVTIVSPAATAQTAFTISATGYSAP